MDLLEMETIADRVDNEDSHVEGSSMESEEFKRIGHPYTTSYVVTSSLVYQIIMSPLMSSVLARAEYIEVDTTYDENTSFHVASSSDDHYMRALRLGKWSSA